MIDRLLSRFVYRALRFIYILCELPAQAYNRRRHGGGRQKETGPAGARVSSLSLSISLPKMILSHAQHTQQRRRSNRNRSRTTSCRRSPARRRNRTTPNPPGRASGRHGRPSIHTHTRHTFFAQLKA